MPIPLRISAYLFFLPLFLQAQEESSLPFFTPPSGWEMQVPSSVTPHVKILFTLPHKEGLSPSMNLSIEPTSLSQEEYIKTVKSLHEEDRNKEWQLLGKMQTKAGLAQLTQINTLSEWGPVRILQLIFVKEGFAYVITAAALKKEFSSYYSLFHKALRSFTLTNDLIDALPLLEKRDSLRSLRESLLVKQVQEERESSFHSFAKEVHAQASELGPYWEYLLLQQTENALKNPPLSNETAADPS